MAETRDGPNGACRGRLDCGWSTVTAIEMRLLRRVKGCGTGSFFLGHGDAESGFEARQSLADLVERAVKEHLHPLFARGLAKLIEGSSFLDELRQSGSNADDLEDADAAAIAQCAGTEDSPSADRRLHPE